MSLKLISLDGCPYSMAAESLLKDLDMKFNLVKVYQENKDEYKTKKINTFPQVYYNDLLLGGYTDLKELHDTLSSLENLDEMIKYLNTKYRNNISRKNISRKNKLRIIKLFIR